MFDVTYLWTNW